MMLLLLGLVERLLLLLLELLLEELLDELLEDTKLASLMRTPLDNFFIP
jgi:hypothetical protein